jgi:RNA polymerase sigma-70 factor (ECF subfamily)
MGAEAFGMSVEGELSPVLAALRRSPFGAGSSLISASKVLSGVESALVAKAAAQSGTRAKLTPAQMEARAQQRVEDDDLIREAQKGDRTAFDALVRRYDQSVLRLALHMLANEQDAQDVHQEAFIKAYRHLGNFRFECSFYTWPVATSWI